MNKIMIEKYKNGSSLRELAKLFDCSKSKITTALKKAKVKIRSSITQETNKRSLKSGKQNALPYYGFCYLEGQIIKDPKEFPSLSKIHLMHEQGMTIHQITQSLNKNKMPSRLGKVWSWAAVRNIIERFIQKKVILKKGGEYEFR